VCRFLDIPDEVGVSEGQGREFLVDVSKGRLVAKAPKVVRFSMTENGTFFNDR